MKKYRAPLALFLFVFCHATAMEKVCYLNRMPRDILDYIAIFLTCNDETDEQFIARIRLEYEEKKREREEKQKVINERGYYTEGRTRPCIRACNIDQTKLIFCSTDMKIFELHDYLDRDKKGVARSYSYQEKSEWLDIDCIALSSKGQLVALYFYKKFSGEKKGRFMLEIIKIDTQKQERNGVLILQKRRELPCDFIELIDGIAFNKQDNKLVAYNSDKDFVPTIFSLKNIDQNKTQVIAPTNKLQEYFRDKLVCQKYIEGRK
ncbi:MAG TPA: hypothetical protein VHX42_00935 [Candidatus Babeliales bacterium]|jgi:hypothetical protein|nr:hypothetical protein [Candidatus Babeliales bacterium]